MKFLSSLSTRHYVYIVGLMLMALVLTSCAGFDLGDLVKVKTPNNIQQTTGLPSTLSLNEAEVEYQNWFNQTQTTGAQWKGNIEKAGELRGLFSQLTLSALDTVGPTVAGLPVLGPALPALTGIVGLFIGSGRLRKEKEASFNKGLEKGSGLAGGTPAGGSGV
ncbi:MAG: hypothetical protein KF864_01390 [Phycisphaeraceae bacterium]|jgi:hypothetical protein|nr:hypothetical protein [Phycisphaeraceae bacterium]